mmetsp:Transcript_25462/g.80117  ORF Transcript_25462/g.80117 Transcript_25462/m.80117 type:complete len:205 (-) Transcript_25462:187-801(-)
MEALPLLEVLRRLAAVMPCAGNDPSIDSDAGLAVGDEPAAFGGAEEHPAAADLAPDRLSALHSPLLLRVLALQRGVRWCHDPEMVALRGDPLRGFLVKNGHVELLTRSRHQNGRIDAPSGPVMVLPLCHLVRETPLVWRGGLDLAKLVAYVRLLLGKAPESLGPAAEEPSTSISLTPDGLPMLVAAPLLRVLALHSGSPQRHQP